MKIVELVKPKLSVYVNNEEADLLKLFDSDNPKWLKRDFDDRQLQVANQLVQKDLLKRTKEDGRIVFKRRIR